MFIRAISLAAVCLAAAPPASALEPCALITTAEAALLLGAPVVSAAAGPDTCAISAAESPGDRIQLALATVAPQHVTRLLKHMDEARGDETPSLHGDPWYELSAIDPARPHDRMMVIYRDRTSLTIDVRSARQPDERAALERVWLDIARRLPTDEPTD